MFSSKSAHETDIACNLDALTAEEKTHHVAVSRELLASVCEVRELPQGYAFRLPADSAMLFKLADFIRHERLCCSFWAFGVEIEPQSGPIWFSLTGPDGVKQIVALELANFLNENVAAQAGLR